MHPRHMNLFRIFYDIQSITHSYWCVKGDVDLRDCFNFWLLKPCVLLKIKVYIKYCKHVTCFAGKPRGHMVMSRLDSPTSLVLFRIFPVFSVSLSRHKTGGFSTFISLWRKWLSQSATLSEVLQDMTSEKVTSHSCEGVASAKTCCSKGCKTDVTAETTVPIAKDKDLLQDEFMTEIQKCIMYILQIAENISPGECILTTNVDLKCVQDQSKEHACVLQVLLSELESLPLFKEINEILAKLYFESPAAQQVLNKLGLVSDGLCSTSVKLCKANSQEEACNLAKRLTHSHFLAIFLLSWPYAKGDNSILNALEQEVVLKQNSVLQSECSTLRKQISLLMKLCQDDGHCAEWCCVSHVTRKPVFGVCKQFRHKQTCIEAWIWFMVLSKSDSCTYLSSGQHLYNRFGSKLYRQNVGIPMGTNCAPLDAVLFLFCYERDFMKSLTKEKWYDLIDAFNSTSRYLDDLLIIDNIHFEHIVHRMYPAELQLNKANASDTEAAFLDKLIDS